MGEFTDSLLETFCGRMHWYQQMIENREQARQQRIKDEEAIAWKRVQAKDEIKENQEYRWLDLLLRKNENYWLVMAAIEKEHFNLYGTWNITVKQTKHLLTYYFDRYIDNATLEFDGDSVRPVLTGKDFVGLQLPYRKFECSWDEDRWTIGDALGFLGDLVDSTNITVGKPC